MSSFKDFQALRRVIEKLDAPRKQVFIEALILEVTTDKSRDVGVSYHAGKGQDIAGKQSLLLGGFDAQKTLGDAMILRPCSTTWGPERGAVRTRLDSSQTKIFGVLNVNIPSLACS